MEKEEYNELITKMEKKLEKKQEEHNDKVIKTSYLSSNDLKSKKSLNKAIKKKFGEP